MMTLEATLSLIVSCMLAIMLVHSAPPAPSNSLYGVMLANDFAESTMKSGQFGNLVAWLENEPLVPSNPADGLGNALLMSPNPADGLEAYMEGISPSSSICFEIEGESGQDISQCPPNPKSSFVAERLVLIKSPLQIPMQGAAPPHYEKVMFKAHFY
ncbi:MAG TPA: hypothetical protein PLO51_02390 [Candidatus Micrarchaeota archaeon]|nr:hypothetical protein [Candidatus Micrarchaeota archaeon]